MGRKAILPRATLLRWRLTGLLSIRSDLRHVAEVIEQKLPNNFRRGSGLKTVEVLENFIRRQMKQQYGLSKLRCQLGRSYLGAVVNYMVVRWRTSFYRAFRRSTNNVIMGVRRVSVIFTAKGIIGRLFHGHGVVFINDTFSGGGCVKSSGSPHRQ